MRKCKIFLFILFIILSVTARVQELYRPAYHYSPHKNWMNDPNGLVFYNNKYHLFYQYNPSGMLPGNTSWGHAVSTDLVNWEEKSIAIPVQNGIMAYSGSVVVDWNNTSGFGINGKPPLVAIYTGAGTVEDQRIAYSNDEGFTWTNYSNNPVITLNSKQFRDPKVIWHKESQKWIMVVAAGFNNQVNFYNSPDLRHWSLLEAFGPVGNKSGVYWECPDLLKLPVNGDTNNVKWVLVHSLPAQDHAQYFVGDFDGKHFSWQSPAPNGVLIADFENVNYDPWTIVGNAFGGSPAAGNIGIQNTVSGYLGDHLVNSYNNDYGSQGKLISPSFTIEKKFISFLIGGGNYLEQAFIKLIVNGKVVRRATGRLDNFLKWKNWDVSTFIGQSAHIEIVDSSTANWGYILADHIIQSDVMIDKTNTGQLDHGGDFYASQSFSDIPASDGRTIWLGWMNNWNYATNIPTDPWKGIMSIPREVKLETHNGQLKLVQKPVKEMASLRADRLSLTNRSLSDINKIVGAGTNHIIYNPAFKVFELKAKIAVTNQDGFVLRFKKRGTEYSEFVFDFIEKEIRLNRSKSGKLTGEQDFKNIQAAPLITENGFFDIDLFVDNCSAELFSANGQVVMSNQIFPDSTSNQLELIATGNDVVFESFDIWRLEKGSSLINTASSKSLYTIYPNPVMNGKGLTIKTKVDVTGMVKFKLFDVTGKLLLEFQPFANLITLPSNTIPRIQGIYFLRGSDGKTTQTEKIVVVGD